MILGADRTSYAHIKYLIARRFLERDLDDLAEGSEHLPQKALRNHEVQLHNNMKHELTKALKDYSI